MRKNYADIPGVTLRPVDVAQSVREGVGDPKRVALAAAGHGVVGTLSTADCFHQRWAEAFAQAQNSTY